VKIYDFQEKINESIKINKTLKFLYPIFLFSQEHQKSFFSPPWEWDFYKKYITLQENEKMFLLLIKLYENKPLPYTEKFCR